MLSRRHEIAPEDAAARLEASADRSRPQISGEVVDGRRHEPVGGVDLVARIAGTSYGEEHDQALGIARTGPDGRFTIVLGDDAPEWARTVVEHGRETELAIEWTLDGHGGTVPAVLHPHEHQQFAVVEIPLEAEEERAVDWSALAHDVAAAGASRLNEVVSGVLDGRFAAGATAPRVVDELETSFLDPDGVLGRYAPLPPWAALAADGLREYEASLGRAADEPEVRRALTELAGRVASFDHLLQVDWPIDVEQLRSGRIGRAVNAFADDFKRGVLTPVRLRGNTLIGYRDYLVSVWARLAAMNWYWANQTPLTAAQAREQLQNRFHQDFTTGDTTAVVANELAAAIVRQILTGAPPTGLGAAATSIPARGAKTPREYLDSLVALSGQAARELGLRYRIDLGRDDGAKISPVEQNIATLQAFFRDAFQSQRDPFHTPPDVRNDAIVPAWQHGKAPFFLEYEEWLAQTAPFFGENMFSITRSLALDELLTVAGGIGASDPNRAFAQAVIPVFQGIAKGIKLASQSELRAAAIELDNAFNGARSLLRDRIAAGYNFDAALAARRRRQVRNKPELLLFERYLGFPNSLDNPAPYDPPGDWNADRFAAALGLYAAYFYWVLRSEIHLGLGEFTQAATCLESLAGLTVGAAAQDNDPGYFDYWNDNAAYLYTAGPLPYTVDRSDKPQPVMPWFHDVKYEGAGGIPDWMLPPYRTAPKLHRLDIRFVQLRLGEVLLEWADALFRADDASSTARARELYKAVLWLHDEDPEISPDWPEQPAVVVPIWWGVTQNPAVTSQVQRARLGFMKIERGLNYFGTTESMVPVQRYRTLKDAADRFAALAKAAERDFLTAIQNLEELSVEQLRTSNLMAKAHAQRDIAADQEKVAAYNVALAQRQVAEIKSQIDAKRKEIADHDSFLGQLGDFAGGVVKTFTGLPGGVTSGIGEGFTAELSGGEASSAGLLGLGAGASILAGFGVFWYAGYTTMSDMASAQNGRAAEIHRLEEVTLPLAQQGVGARQAEVDIARLQASIADADISLARDLLAFHTSRLLNAEFWAAVASVLKRVLRRYLDLGAWSAWLAERALAFEQARHLRIVRMDYLPRQLQGVTGGDLLQADLAELEAARIAGERALVPFRLSLSLVEDFPLAFGTLKTNGSCTFSTLEASAAAFFPGTFGHRIRGVDVAIRQLPPGRRVRGILVNHGLSMASRDESLVGEPLLRFADALAVSESGSGADGDPRAAEVLNPFEGAGLETTWTLELDRDASPGWWDAISDVVITIDGLARFSEAVREQARPAPPRRFILISAARFGLNAGAIGKIRQTGKGPIELDLAHFPFAAAEKNRRATNAMVLLPGAGRGTVHAHLHVANPVVDADFTIVDGVATSNGEPLRLPGSTTPDAPLNAAIGHPLERQWKIEILPSAGVDLSKLTDVILGVEYHADPV